MSTVQCYAFRATDFTKVIVGGSYYMNFQRSWFFNHEFSQLSPMSRLHVTYMTR